MEFKYYEWFYFLEKNCEVIPSETNTYFKTYFEKSLSVKISERYNSGKVNGIYYHEITSIDLVKDFHHTNYPDKPMFTVKHLKNTVILESFSAEVIRGIDIFNFDEHRKLISIITLEGDKKLSEFREIFYDQDKEAKEKIVFKTNHHWHVIEEDLTELG